MATIFDLFEFTTVPGLPMPKVTPPGWVASVFTLGTSIEIQLGYAPSPTGRDFIMIGVRKVGFEEGANFIESGMEAKIFQTRMGGIDVRDVRLWQDCWRDAIESTRIAYAERLLDLLTWIPGPAGDGWRKMKEECRK